MSKIKNNKKGIDAAHYITASIHYSYYSTNGQYMLILRGAKA